MINEPSHPSPLIERMPNADSVAGLFGLAAGWIAVGGMGLLGHPLRHALTWLAVGGIALALGPRFRWKYLPLTVAGLLAALALTSTSNVTVNVSAAVIAMVALLVAAPRRCTATLLAAEAVTVLAVFHFARTSIPFVWQAADATGTLAGRLVGAMTGQPLWVGAGFAGIDFLVVAAYLAVMAPFRFAVAETEQRSLLLRGLLAVALGYVLYLGILSSAAVMGEALQAPEASSASALHGAPESHTWRSLVAAMIPWNLPLVGLVIHLAVAGTIFRLARKRGTTAAGPGAAAAGETAGAVSSTNSFRGRVSFAVAGGLLAAASVMIVAPPNGPPDLSGKRIVLYEKGFLNWLRPTHGQYGRFSIGMYGMLPTFLQSLGAETAFSTDLTPQDLKDADALVVIFPDEPWEPGQLDAVWDFVKRGGSLLVMGEHTVVHDNGTSRFNELLAPTDIRVRFDSATFTVGGWLQSYETLWHATTAGIDDTENEFGIVIGASVRARPPARPLIIGRWGWADPGDVSNASAMMGNGSYDAGERLGDVVLAAEQSFGQGKVVVFGDTSGLSNGINIGGHPFTSRLFAYLVDPDAQPLASWRQTLGILALAALGVLLAAAAEPLLLTSVVASLAICLTVATDNTHAAWNVVPDGKYLPDQKLAYIDGGHLGHFSRESWRDDGLAGLSLTLMRNGYLTLMSPKLTDRELQGAELLVSVAPSRPYTAEERASIKRFVEQGGIFICTVGNDRAGPSEPLLSELGFHVGTLQWQGNHRDGVLEPLGYFKSPYFNNGDQMAYVRFHAAWPIHCSDPDAQIIAHYPPHKPLIVARRLGRGRVVVIGDTCFAQNMNLEQEGGEPFEGMRENADFWRWLLAWLSEDEPWYPLPVTRQSSESDSTKPIVESSAAADQAVRRSAPTKQVPTKQVPTKRVPTKRVPTKRAPTKQVTTPRSRFNDLVGSCVSVNLMAVRPRLLPPGRPRGMGGNRCARCDLPARWTCATAFPDGCHCLFAAIESSLADPLAATLPHCCLVACRWIGDATGRASYKPASLVASLLSRFRRCVACGYRFVGAGGCHPRLRESHCSLARTRRSLAPIARRDGAGRGH